MMIELQKDKRERAIAVAVAAKNIRREQAEEYLDELTLLADTAGADIIHKILQVKDRLDSAYYIGKGKAEQIAQLADDDNISLVIFDDDLSPGQARNLEKLINKKIVDRSGLILDIFASRAQTNEAKTQVELAQLQYMLPRLTRLWTHFSKQLGGIGTRGPGETQIETDRRMIRERIASLREKLEKIVRQRKTQRKGRKEFFNVSLVGYTNVGKSTLLNILSEAKVFVENRLFATLDPTTRIVRLDDGSEILLTDTVGFIRKLPHHLVASFKSTLEETIEADLLLHIVDLSHPHMEDQIRVVQNTITDLGVAHKPVIYVFNKVDTLEDRTVIKDIQARYAPSVFISAQRGINIIGLKELISASLHASYEEMSFSLPQHEYKILSKIHDMAEVISQSYDENGIHLKIKVSSTNSDFVKRILATVKQQ